MKKIRIGVLGADRRGKISLCAHKPEQGSEIAAVCGLHPERLAFYKDVNPSVKITADYREVLGDSSIDAVFVCTPDYLHEEHTLAAIDAGKHVYLEKPMAITIEGCNRILRAAKKKDVNICLGHNMRFMSIIRKMKDLVDSGRIGEVQAIWCRHFISYGGDAYFRDWHSERRYAHGLLLQKAAHDIDVIHWLCGSYATRVVGMGKLSVYDKLPRRKEGDPLPDVSFDPKNWPPKATSGYSPEIDVEDHSMILMQMENGVQSSYMQCHYAPDDVRNYTVIGTEGRIENYGDHSTPEKWATVHLWNQRTGYSELGHEVFRVPHADGEHGGSDPLIVGNFLDYLRGKPPQGATPIDARMAVAAGYLGTESIRNGNVPYDIPPVAF